MINRQLRRAEEKKERKAEREKERVKAERIARREERRKARRAQLAKPAGDASNGSDRAERKTGPRQSNPGRFSGALMFATVFFISLQAVAPTDGTIPSQLVSASFYLLFGYFAVLWMFRRGAQRELTVTIIGGALMAIVTLVSQWLQPTLEVQPIMIGFAVPLTVLGALLGRLVWNRAP